MCRARRQARGRERRHAVDQRRAADHSALVAEGDRPPVRGRPARGQVADGRGERDRLAQVPPKRSRRSSEVSVGRAVDELMVTVTAGVTSREHGC